MATPRDEYLLVINKNKRIEEAAGIIENSLGGDLTDEIREAVTAQIKKHQYIMNRREDLYNYIEGSTFAIQANDGEGFPDGWEDIEYDFRDLEKLTDQLSIVYDDCLDMLGIYLA